jgi:peroxiredoxin (alkyl hydroperoxide reductase subunit C)
MSHQRVKVGQTPPDFTLEDTQGEPVTLSSFKGDKNVYLVFNRGFF